MKFTQIIYVYIYIIIYKLDVLYCYIYLIQKQYIWKVIIQPCSNQMKSPASASSSTRQKLTTPLRSMALDDDSGTTFFFGQKTWCKTMGKSGLHRQKSWDSVEIGRISTSKNCDVWLWFPPKNRWILGKSEDVSWLFSSKNTFWKKKNMGISTLKKKQKRDLEVTPWGILYPDRSCHVLSKKNSTIW